MKASRRYSAQRRGKTCPLKAEPGKHLCQLSDIGVVVELPLATSLGGNSCSIGIELDQPDGERAELREIAAIGKGSTS